MIAMPATAQDHEARYLDQLRSRRLFVLAEQYCQDELETENDAARKASLVMELSRTLIEHGKYLPKKERAKMWLQAERVLFDGSGSIPIEELKVRLQAQGAINVAHQATFLRWQSQVTPQDNYLKELALVRIQLAQKSLASAASRAQNASAAAPFERDALRNTLDFHQAQTLMDQARLEQPESAERIGLASEAGKTAKRLSSTAVDNRTRVKARVLYAECCLERGDSRRAISVLDSALELAVDDEERDHIFAERVRVLLYDQRPDEATKQLIRWRKERGSLSGELHVLRMQSLIALWEIARAAKNEQLAEELISQMETGSNYARQEVGGYWAFRCERLLAGAREVSLLGNRLATLKQKAEQDYSEGDLTAAAKNFGLAANEAIRKDKSDVGATLFYQQGSVLVQDKQIEPAASAFRSAVQAGGTAKSNDAHLMHAWCLGRLYQQNATKSRREAYTSALEEHRRLYKTGDSFAEATFMLASLEETRLQNTKAIELYKQIQVHQQPRYAQASAAIARCYSKVVTRLKKLDKSALLTEWLNRGIVDLSLRVAEIPNAPAKPNIDHAEVLVQTASIMLHQPSPDYKTASSYLQRGTDAIKGLKASPRINQLRAVAERWRLVTAIAGGNAEAAMAWATNLENRPAEELFAVIESLDEITGSDRAIRLAMSSLRLRVGELAIARRKSLSPQQQLKLAAWMVGTYFDSGKRPEALAQARLVVDSSAEAQTLSKVSAMVQTLKTQEGQSLARRGWKKLEANSKAGSSTWLNARLHVAECTLQLGESEVSRKLIEVTRLLYPDLGGPQLKSAFDALEAKLP